MQETTEHYCESVAISGDVGDIDVLPMTSEIIIDSQSARLLNISHNRYS